MRDRNIYVKEEVDALLDFLDCDAKPATTIRHFGRQFLACETPEAQKIIMFKWLMGWNPLLVKSVFEALDREAGGRLHSTNELYRMITSYAFAGEHITLPSFQAWIKWMAATEHIRYIGIRWGLGDLGKQALALVKHIDVDEVLEDEEEAREAGIAEVHPMLAGLIEAPAEIPVAMPDAPDDSPAPPLSEPTVQADRGSEVADDLPDMPPEAPVPVPEGSPEPKSVPEEPSPSSAVPRSVPLRNTAASTSRVSVQSAWFPAGPGNTEITAAELGFDARQYGADPALFSFRLACAARLVVSGVPQDTSTALFKHLDSEGVFERYFAKKRSFEEILAGLGWLQSTPFRAAFSWVVLDFMGLRQRLEERPGFPDQLEQKGPADALYTLHQELFGAALDGAAFWYAREMTTLELWER
jgi:hypothetical protein